MENAQHITPTQRARLMGWAVDPGHLRLASPRDWLAEENNSLASRRESELERVNRPASMSEGWGR